MQEVKEEHISYIEKRSNICNSCEHLKIIVGAKFCNSCGCAIWGKTMMKGQSCPEGKWDAEQN